MRLADRLKDGLSMITDYINPFYRETRCDWDGLCYPALIGCKNIGERAMIGTGSLELYKCEKYSQQKD